jgi:dethiobiotin synthetase/adenosylmethionine--8-amino-7-oxononanoate aminotransferase
MIRSSFFPKVSSQKALSCLSHRLLSNGPSSLPISKLHPTHLIFGANTDVGKTVLSTALVRASVHNNENVNYIKPLQCGGSDEQFVNKYLDNTKNENDGCSFNTHTLHYWDMPASPHLASRTENKPASDDQVLSSVYNKLNEIHREYDNGSVVWIETAGGILSPSAASPLNKRPRHASDKELITMNNKDSQKESVSSWGWSTQGDLYQPLHLPVILIGDGRLGGISVTLSALESLLTRGYDVHAIALIEDSADLSGHGSNLPALKEYASRCMALRSGNGRALFKNIEKSIVSFPAVPSDLNIPLNDWFNSQQVMETSNLLKNHLCNEWENHVGSLEGLRNKGTKVLWWPFTQHKSHDDEKVKATLIDGASGDNFSIVQNVRKDSKDSSMERTSHFDACASWWTQGMGHGESSLGLAAAAAAGRYGHVIFPDVVHEPATELADRLVNSDIGPGQNWASRVFFTDDGSTAMEVAIKMGMKKFAHDRNLDLGSKGITLTVCAQRDCYHGDTLGVMDVAEPSIFNEGQHPWYEPKGLFLAYPTVRYKDGIIGITFPLSDLDHRLNTISEVFDVDKRLSTDLYKQYFNSIEHEWDAYEALDESR